MRSILRKVRHLEVLNEEEYRLLLNYINRLKKNSPESWQVFYSQYAYILANEYSVYCTRFSYGLDDLYEYLIHHTEIIAAISKHPIPCKNLPAYLHEYLFYTCGETLDYQFIEPLVKLFDLHKKNESILPAARKERVVIKYEENNPYKEQGLKNHFDRIAHYSFVSRIQTYRYLTGNKATFSKIEILGDDCLRGIFTNKQKSIYYYIFLTEKDRQKAMNACRVLNMAIFGQQ